MARTLSQIRSAVMQLTTPRYQTGTPDSVAAGSLTDNPLQKYGNGYFTGHFVLDSAGVVFLVSDSTQASGNLALRPTGTTPGAGTYEVSLFDPAVLLTCINRAARKAHPLVSLHYVNTGYVTGSPVTDPSFDDWTSSSVLRAWAAVTATLDRVTADPIYGGNVARLSTAAGYLHPDTQYQTDLIDLRGHNITIYAIAKTAVGSNARINGFHTTKAGAAVNTYGSYHSGGGGWELLSVNVTIPSDAQGVDIRLVNDTTTLVDWDSVWVEGGPMVRRHRLPGPIAQNVAQVEMGYIEDRSFWRSEDYKPWPYWRVIKREDAPGNQRYELEWTRLPPAGMRMRITGPAPLTNLVVATDEWEITDTESEYVEIRAALELLDNTAMGIAAQSQAHIREIQQRLLEWAAEQKQHLFAPTFGAYSLGFDL